MHGRRLNWIELARMETPSRMMVFIPVMEAGNPDL